MADRAEFESELRRLITHRNIDSEEAMKSLFYAIGFLAIDHRESITKIMKTANERFEAENGKHI